MAKKQERDEFSGFIGLDDIGKQQLCLLRQYSAPSLRLCWPEIRRPQTMLPRTKQEFLKALWDGEYGDSRKRNREYREFWEKIDPMLLPLTQPKVRKDPGRPSDTDRRYRLALRAKELHASNKSWATTTRRMNEKFGLKLTARTYAGMVKDLDSGKLSPPSPVRHQ